MTEIHPLTKKKITPIEVATHSRAKSPPNVNTIFTVDPKENQIDADMSKGKPVVLNVVPLHVSRTNEKTPNHKTGSKSDNNKPVQQTERDPSQHSLSSSYDTSGISENFDTSLEDEKFKHERNALERKEKFRAIIMGEQAERDWRKLAIDILIAIMPSVATIIPTALIPQHNLLLDPEYWYESWIYSTPLFIWSGLSTSFMATHYINVTSPVRPRNLMIMSLSMMTFLSIFVLATVWIWTQTLNYYYPVPLMSYLFAWPILATLLLTTWMSFPSIWRQTRKFRGRMMYFTLLLVYPTIIFRIQLETTSKALVKYQNEYQIIMPLLLPCIREVNLWIIPKFTKKAADGDLAGANIIARFSLSAWYTLSLCFFLGSSTTTTTTWVLVVTDFTVNTILCIRIVWIRYSAPDKIEQHIDLIQELAVYELVEFLAPSTFILSFALLVYGPNCDLVGNLCNDYWQFEATQDFTQAFQNMGTFFVLDILSTFVTAIILKTFCQINILYVMTELLKEFKYGFCGILGTRIFNVNKITFVSKISLQRKILCSPENINAYLIIVIPFCRCSQPI